MAQPVPEFLRGREAIVAFLQRKWARELDYRLIKAIWAQGDDRIAVRFTYEWHDDSGNWYGSYGNENWEFDLDGLMKKRHASINDLPISGPMATPGCLTWGFKTGGRTIRRTDSPALATGKKKACFRRLF